MRSEKVRISCSILRSNSEIGDMTLAKCPGLQPGRRIAREKVRSRVLCVLAFPDAWVRTRANNASKLVSLVLEYLTLSPWFGMCRCCHQIVKVSSRKCPGVSGQAVLQQGEFS